MHRPVGLPVLSARRGTFLRPWRMSDLELVREAAQDDYIPAITTVPSPFTEHQGAAFIRRQWERTAAKNGCPFVIVDAGRPVGAVGLWLNEADQGRATAGYWVAPSGRGRGAAASALATVADWALGALAVPRLELYVEPWNTASVRTAEHAGFRRQGLRPRSRTVRGAPRDMLVYSLPVPRDL
ncbi:GNAT family N-acetyltransferase [Nocardiopsis halophila]|uniref:GNAT family N-acetyltransferase n=1 Tax=Nocardiopsis halophila TaxID=141692 RepID=UPI0003461435|nr:GNAT family protein [Nocardiopsis halophila]